MLLDLIRDAKQPEPAQLAETLQQFLTEQPLALLFQTNAILNQNNFYPLIARHLKVYITWKYKYIRDGWIGWFIKEFGRGESLESKN